jgi:hypothetical protein
MLTMQKEAALDGEEDLTIAIVFNPVTGKILSVKSSSVRLENCIT